VADNHLTCVYGTSVSYFALDDCSYWTS